jgi:hypothetical protein
MKKIIFALFMSMALLPSYAGNDDENWNSETIDFTVETTPLGSSHPGRPKAPLRKPQVYKSNSELTFVGAHPTYTLYIISENGVEYFTDIPTSVHVIQLPAFLSGSYEIRLIQGNFMFYSDINL